MPESASPDAQTGRPLRADARRNRERVLLAAREMFAAEGLSVSLDDIARRAGVGPGTVHRHFRTKDDLLEAVLADRLRALTDTVRELAEAPDAGEAFFAFFQRVVEDAHHNLALSAALTNPADLGEAVLEAGAALATAVGVLLTRAQQAGAVRNDIDTADLHAIIAGALATEQRLSPSSRGRGMTVVADGLRR
jgi:AcrR family transcriptional regulator